MFIVADLVSLKTSLPYDPLYQLMPTKQYIDHIIIQYLQLDVMSQRKNQHVLKSEMSNAEVITY